MHKEDDNAGTLPFRHSFFYCGLVQSAKKRRTTTTHLSVSSKNANGDVELHAQIDGGDDILNLTYYN
jgi:hypothetical protein